MQQQVRSLRYLPAYGRRLPVVADSSDDVRTLVRNLRSLISSDPALCAKLLQVANSSIYRHCRQVGTLDFALMVVGFDAASEILIGVRLVSSLQSEPACAIRPDDLTKHSVTTALLSDTIARTMRYPVTGEAFVAGLLNDIGLSVLNQLCSRGLERAGELAMETDVSFQEAEERVMGLTHADVGSWLADEWGFPEHLVEAIAFHHTPGRAERKKELVAIVHVADALSPRLTNSIPDWEKGVSVVHESLGDSALSDPVTLEEIFSRSCSAMKSSDQFETMPATTEE
ncbi:MAG: HDOD domain-containing protein [Bacteroidetes bacterium]|nr:HDOD domain-containing protein [Bacteroidota bacterium]